MNRKILKNLTAGIFSLAFLAFFASAASAAVILTGDNLTGDGTYGDINSGDFSGGTLNITASDPGIDITGRLNLGTKQVRVYGTNNTVTTFSGGNATDPNNMGIVQVDGASNSAGTNTLKIAAGTVTNVAGEFRVGTSGANNNQRALLEVDGATLNVTAGYLCAGFAAGSYGVINLTGSDVTTSSYVIVGREGKGEVNMTGGTLTMRENFLIGDLAGSNGTFTLNSGDVHVGSTSAARTTRVGKDGGVGKIVVNGGNFYSYGQLQVGSSGAGSGTVEMTGGTIYAYDQMSVGREAAGTLIMTGGTINADKNSGGGNIIFYVGWHADGTIVQSGGTINASEVYFADQNYHVLNDPSSGAIVATYTMSRDSVFNVTGGFSVGQHARGILTLNGGTINAAGRTLILGNMNNDVSHGTLNIAKTDDAFGSTMNIANVQVGNNAGALGDVNVSGGWLNATDTIHVGYVATGRTVGSDFVYGGTMTQTGGKVDAAYLRVGTGGGSTGLYNMAGGDLNITENFVVGYNATGRTVGSDFVYGGTVKQTGGNVAVAKILAIGGYYTNSDGGATGYYEATGGKLEVHELIVGGKGTGVLTVDGGEVIIGNGALRLGRGDNNATNGTVNVRSGSITAASAINVGDNNNAVGVMTQTGGKVAATQLNISTYANSVGTYTISGDAQTTLNISRVEVGQNGIGTMNINGGTTTVNGTMIVALNTQGTWTDGVITQYGGTVKQSGGALITSGILSIGGEYNNGNGNATGYYELTGGTITTPEIIIGGRGTGVMTIDGSTAVVNISSSMHLGRGNNGTTTHGTLNMKAGSLTIAAGQSLNLGSQTNATGIINQTGGTITAPTVNIGAQNVGIYTMDGGTLNASTFQVAPAANTTGTFTLNGGTVKIGSNVAKGAGNATIKLGSGTIGALAAYEWNVDVAAEFIGNTAFDTSGGAITVRSFLTGDGGLTKTGTGTMLLSRWNTGASAYGDTNTFTGPITVNDGTLSVERYAATNAQSITVNADGTLLLAGSSALSGSDTSITPKPTLILNEGTLNTDSGSSHNLGDIVFTSGSISIPNTSRLIFDGAVTVNANTTGDSTISGYEIEIGKGGTFAIAAGGVLNITADIVNPAGSTSNQVITKTGAGELIFSGSVAADVKLQGGTVLISNETRTLDHSLTNSGGRLDLVNSADGVNKFYIGGSYFQEADADLYIQVVKNAVGNYEFDSLNVEDVLSLDGTLTLLLNELWTYADYKNGVALKIFGDDYAGVGDFSSIIWSAGQLDSDLFWYFNPMDGTLRLGVPEPATWGMLLAGLIGLMWFRRRRG